MDSFSSGSMNSHKRRLDNFLQGIGSSRTSSPSRPSTAMAAAERPTTPTTTSFPSAGGAGGGDGTEPESLAAKRQRLGISSSATTQRTANKLGATATTTTSVPGNLLKKWTSSSSNSNSNSNSNSSINSNAFSANRKSILLVNPSDASTSISRRLVPHAAPVALYNPSDRDALLARLATFQELTDWTPKPERVSEVEWAKKGWVCRGRERVACQLCKRELVVGLNKKEVDGKQVSVLVPSEIEQALVDKHVDMMTAEHLEDCPWRKLSCHDSLLRVPMANSKDAMADLYQRYDQLVERKDFLPYEFNLRLPAEVDLDAILVQLPPDFFPIEETSGPPNRVALALALFGWQRLATPSARMSSAIRDTVSCHTCLRRLGLWMFKTKQVGPDGRTVITPAPMDHLDPISEHRFFCPFKNADAQRAAAAAPNPESDMPAWKRLAQVIASEASVRAARLGKPRKSFIERRLGVGVGVGSGGITTTSRSATPSSTPARAGAASPAPSVAGSAFSAVSDGDDDNNNGEDDEKVRDAKDKAMLTRLRSIKRFFVPKDKSKLSRPSSRASTSAGPVSQGQQDQAAS